MGFFSKIFGSIDENKGEAQMSQQIAVRIIQEYGAVMEHDSPVPGCVADVSKLPYAKSRIKEALKIGLRATSDAQMREILKVGYLRLADWQEGVGESDIGLDLAGIDPDTDVMKLAERIIAQGDGYENWGQIVTAEQESLKSELIALGFWDEHQA